MIYQDFKDECEKRMHKKGLHSSKYKERLAFELDAMHFQAEDYKANIFSYFMDLSEKHSKGEKLKNTNNMLVSHVLDITDEDPIKEELELIKTKGAEYPDIDTDFEHTQRDYVKEYLIQKYGQEHVASICAMHQMHPKTVIKDVARIKNIPFEEVNDITKLIKDKMNVGGVEMPTTIELLYENIEEINKFFNKYAYLNLLDLCTKLDGNVRHLGMHAAGVVITPKNKPLNTIVGLEKTKDAYVTCWQEGDERELSKIGVIKFDILGLNTLTVIKEALRLIKENHGVDVDIDEITLDDKRVLQGFHDANTIGIFQFERDWIRSLLRKIKITTFEDISAVNALNRPGPLDAGMDKKFWMIKNGFEKPSYLHPLLEPILKNTYCIILYQEQVMEISQKLAGFGADEADAFRSVLSKGKADMSKGINPFAKHEKKFIDGCLKNGVKGKIKVERIIRFEAEMPVTATSVRVLQETSDANGPYKKIACEVEIADELFSQIKTFAGYGFNKSHSVEYGFLAYQCLAGPTLIYDWDKREYTTISKAFKNNDVKRIACYDEETGKTIPGEIKKIIRTTGAKNKNLKMGYKLKTKNGKSITCSEDHPILTKSGEYIKLKDLKIGDEIACEKRVLTKNVEFASDKFRKSFDERGLKISSGLRDYWENISKNAKQTRLDNFINPSVELINKRKENAKKQWSKLDKKTRREKLQKWQLAGHNAGGFKHTKKSVSKCGHKAHSSNELELCNWLFDNGVEHITQATMETFGFADVLAKGVYIEFDGMNPKRPNSYFKNKFKDNPYIVIRDKNEIQEKLAFLLEADRIANGKEIIFDEIISIKKMKNMVMYDISMEKAPHNFLANNIVVHNCMYLKTFYPKEFMASLLTHTPNKVDLKTNENKFADYLYEARRMGLKALPPNINKSVKEARVVGDDLQTGFSFIKGLGDKAYEEIARKRPFKDFRDFMMKIDGRFVNKSAIFALIHSGSFDDFLEIGKDKNNLVKRYDLLREYCTFRKDKKTELPSHPTAIMAISEESEVVGGELFNTLLHLVDKAEANRGYAVDDQIVKFDSINKINSGTKVRVVGVVDSFVIKNTASGNNIGFLVIKNGNKSKKLMVWSTDIQKLQTRPDMMGILVKNNVVAIQIERQKDYKDGKTFVLRLDGIKKLL